MSDCRFGVSPVNYPDPDPERYFITSVKKFMQRLASGKKCSIYPLLFLLLPDTFYISIKSNIRKYMHSLYQILSDCFLPFDKPYRQETT